jgi:hypothetical protein
MTLVHVVVAIALGFIVAFGHLGIAAERAADAIADDEADAERADTEGDRATTILFPPVERLRNSFPDVLILSRHCVLDLRYGLRNRFARLFHATLKVCLRQIVVVRFHLRRARCA